MIRYLYIKCPYCGSEQARDVKIKDHLNKLILTCDDVDYPGCGRDFILTTKINIETKVLKIEGEED